MSDLIWRSLDIKHKITDAHLLDILGEVLPIYSTSDFFLKVASLGNYSRDVTVTGMGRFQYRDKVLFQYIPRNKAESAKCIYERCRQVGHLADYRFAVVDNKRGNWFYLIFLSESDSFSNYTHLPAPEALSPDQRNTLFCALEKLAQEGIFVPLYSVSYNKTAGTFSLLDYSDSIVDSSADSGQKREYIEAHKKYLLL